MNYDSACLVTENTKYINRLSLSDIRIGTGHTINEVSQSCELGEGQLRMYEAMPPGEVPASMIMRLRSFYGIPIDYIKV